MKILNFGSCNLDYVYGVDHFVKAGETLPALSMEVFPGGKGLNQSIALARAGAKVYHAGYLGKDGDILLSALSESGADISLIERKDTSNGHAIIQVDKNGENSIIVHGGTNQMLTRAYIDEVLSKFSSEDILLLQNEINEISYIIDAAHRRRIKIVFNPAPFTENLKAVDLGKLYCLIVNETEAEGFCGSDNPAVFLSYIQENFPGLRAVITLGKKGCIYSDGMQRAEHGAFAVDAVDTTAAGDTFIGYFLAHLNAGSAYADALKIASAASAITVSRPGASPSIPYLNEVRRMMEGMVLADTPAENKQKRQKKEMLRYIDENLQAASLSDLAKHMGYAKSYTGILFKSLVGTSFSALLAEKRCEKAAFLLKNTDMPIGEIIPKVGYENESFFRKKFMEMYGKSPLKYRKEGEKE